MEVVSKHIKSLLFTNDCVIIPDFGGLVANPKSAQYNKLSERLSPPHKALGFNIRLNNNDGLLAHEISIKENIDYNEAIEKIKDFVAGLKIKIEETGKIQFGEIGSFYKDVHGNLRFKQNTGLSIDNKYFGLETVQLIPLKKEIPTTTHEESSNIQKVSPEINAETSAEFEHKTKVENEKSEIFPWKKLAIAACLIPFIFYAFWIGTFSNIFSGDEQFQYSDLNPFVEKACEKFSPRITEPTLFLSPEKVVSTLELALEISKKPFLEHSFLEKTDKDLHSKAAVVIQLKNFEAVAISTAVSNDKNLFAPRNQKGFFVITGCFEFYENATKYVAKLRKRGLNASIVDQKNGLFRISASTNTTRSEALQKLEELKTSGYPDAWVLSK